MPVVQDADVHKKTVVACVIRAGAGGPAHKEVRTFGTTTAQLLALADWLESFGVTHVALESTGVYWRPVAEYPARPLRGHSGQCSTHEGGPGP
jgi:transposase